ncbi:MAG: acyl-CoA dehydrogenase family protein, partial [Pseudomonadota bacterium]|nr:acyl-CoA dehydrogenase family protein [Pseudomonadota bacterium]
MAVLNDEQVMLRDMAREWTDNESPVASFRKMRDARGDKGFDAAAWTTQAEMGWAGIVIPEEFGGSAFGFLSLGLVLEQLGRNLAATPLAASAVAASTIALGSDERAKAEWLSKLASGEIVAALAVDEGPVHDPARFATGVADGRLTGKKAFVAEGDAAALFVVAAQDGLYLVADGEGIARTTRHMADSRSHADITFTNAHATRIGGTDLTAKAIDR